MAADLIKHLIQATFHKVNALFFCTTFSRECETSLKKVDELTLYVWGKPMSYFTTMW